MPLEIDTAIGEYTIPGEEEIIRDYVTLFTKHFEKHYAGKDGPARRAIHAKSHGCLRATFSVLDHSEHDLKHGIFSQPATYQAVVRISNGDGPPGADTNKIASIGFAIKVLDVAAEKYLAAQREDSQDFLFLNQPAYISADVRDYRSLMRAIDGGPMSKVIALMRNLRGIRYRLKASPKDNPLNTSFWGVAPFRLGDLAVKYLIRPSNPEPKRQPVGLTNDYLSVLVKERIEQREANFDFFLQRRLLDGSENEKMPIEDYAIAWDETHSVPVHVARLSIRRQQVEERFDQEQGEHLIFSPWNTTKDFRPLGSLNRARRVVYEFSARRRHELNRARNPLEQIRE
jgi:hypothetical protein